jgi:hypothetical protein
VWHAVPVEDLLLLLCPDAVVLIEEIEKGAFGFFECRIGAGFQISKVGENTLLKLLRVFDRTAKGLKTKGEASDDISAGDVEQIVPATNQPTKSTFLAFGYSAIKTNQRTQEI